MAPLNDFTAIDVPGQVDEEVSRRHVPPQERAQILRRHAILDEGHALLDPGPQRRIVRLKIYDGDAFGIDTKVLQQNRQRTSRHSPKPHEQDAIPKLQHLVPSPLFTPIQFEYGIGWSVIVTPMTVSACFRELRTVVH
jgi:hypothetical protein